MSPQRKTARSRRSTAVALATAASILAWAACAQAAPARPTGSRPTPAPARAAEPDPARMTLQEAWHAARKAMQANDLERFDRHAAVIPANGPLDEYLQYWRLRIRLAENLAEPDPAALDREIAAFISARADHVSADLMRRDWMLSLGRRSDWSAFDGVFAQWVLRDENGPLCLSQLSRRKSGTAEMAAIRALLAQPAQLHAACARLFTELADDATLSAADVLQRFRLALESNDTGDIVDAATRLPALRDRPAARAAIDQALRQPLIALAATDAPPPLVAVAVSRLARSDAARAAAWLQDGANAARAGSAEEQRFLWSQVAAAGARRLEADAPAWASRADGVQASDETLVWLVRNALRAGDWPRVLATIDRLGTAVGRDSAWVYWRGRALQAARQPEAARSEFERIRDRRDLYGKLALQALGQPSTRPPARPAPPPERILQFDHNPGLARALAFYQVGMRHEGNREWNFQLRGLGEEDMRAAAHWAQRRGLLDRAISTDERLGSSPDQPLRFPTPFLRELEPVARAQGLSIEWVYGLIRQESRFIMDAQSHAGASGLMQLMPATARWVAQRLGRSDYDPAQITDLRTNLEFGTYYLRSVLDDMNGSIVLATAGYNAGPRRAHAWRAALDRPLEGAVFAEIIPFAETRGYVKNVISNAVDYAALLSGQPQLATEWLGQILPQKRETELP